MVRRRTEVERDPAGLREARCRWFHDRRLRPSEVVRQWEASTPFPGGFEGLTVDDLNDQAQCGCRWCTAFDDEVDPRDEWVRGGA